MTYADRPEGIIFNLLCAVVDRIFYPFFITMLRPRRGAVRFALTSEKG